MGIRSFETRRPSIALVRVEAPRGPQGHGACARTPRCCCFRGPRPGLSPSPPLYDALCLLPGWCGCGSGLAWGSGVRGGRGSRRPLCGFPDVMAAPGGLFANPHCLGAFETISPELVRRPRKKLNIVLGQRGPREGYESLEPVTIQGPRDSQSLWRGHQGHVHVPGADGRQAPPGQTAPRRAPCTSPPAARSSPAPPPERTRRRCTRGRRPPLQQLTEQLTEHGVPAGSVIYNDTSVRESR